MSSRILSDSILTSETLDKLCPEQECLWYRILVSADDYGCMDARPIVVLARCYPLRIGKIQPEQIAEWLQNLAQVGLITLYQVEGKDYLRIAKWEEHQRIRTKRHKCPLPAADGDNSQDIAATLNKLAQSAAICGDLRQSARIAPSSESISLHSESIPNPLPTHSSLQKHRSMRQR
jgi:hypothetical protein